MLVTLADSDEEVVITVNNQGPHIDAKKLGVFSNHWCALPGTTRRAIRHTAVSALDCLSLAKLSTRMAAVSP